MSAFNIGLSGLDAASKDLDVTSNNIANSATVGFKGSRAEFANIYATTVYGTANTQAGTGVNVQAVTQQFNQGNLSTTNNALDLAVSGQGFFALKPNLTNNDLVYTRAGAFQVNQDGYITNSAGQYVMGFPVNSDGSVTATALASTVPIQIPTTSGAPNATQDTSSGQAGVSLSVNLDASDSQPVDSGGAALPFDPTDPTTYNASTSVNVYDSLGTQHTVTYYFAKDTPATPQTWSVYSSIDGYTDQGAGNQPTDGSAVATTVGSLAFDSSGKFDLTNSTLPTVSWTGVPGVEDLNFTTDFGGNSTLGVPSSSQTASAFSVQGINQNGYAPGQLTGIDISSSGVVNANYSNGKSTSLAKVALVNFANPQGLTQIGNNNWQESLNSGAAIAGEAGTGVYGQIKSGALEQSNVDLTAELVHLIVAQRNFQANAKSISTASQVTDTIINVR